MYPTDDVRNALKPIMEKAIANEVTPGGVVCVSQDGQTICEEAFGRTGTGPKEDLVRANTIYDVASLTKPVVTATLLMMAIRDGRLDLGTPVHTLLPELRGEGTKEILVRHLAGHSSGLPPHQRFFERIRSGDFAGCTTPRDALVAMAGNATLVTPPGTQAAYSDLGYILLGRLVERVTEASLDEAFAAKIAKPLGLSDSFFVDLAQRSAIPLARIAPTEDVPGRGLIHGEVHDDNAHAGLGVCGHAGLFSTAKDLVQVGNALAGFGESGFLPADLVCEFWSTPSAPDTTWRLGWDTPSPNPETSHTGEHWPKDSVGHLGFTGTGIWIAPEKRCVVVILTNRVYYSHEKGPIKALRRALTQKISEALF